MTSRVHRSATEPSGSNREPLVGPTNLTRHLTAPWIESIQPKQRQSTGHTSVAAVRGPRYRCVDRCWEQVAGCIVFDFFHCHVWSRPLAALSLLGLMMVLMNYTLVSVLPWDLSPTCVQARQLKSSSVNGTVKEPDEMFHITVDPLSGEKIDVGWVGMLWIMLFILVYLANSAYHHTSWCNRMFTILSICVGALWMHDFARSTIKDARHCSELQHIDWTQYQPNSGRSLFSLEGSSGEGTTWTWPMKVAEFCTFEDLDEFELFFTYDTPPLRTDQSKLVGGEVKNIWAAWMDLALFNVSLLDPNATVRYCVDLLGVVAQSVVPCIAWLNNTAKGNRIECLLGHPPPLLNYFAASSRELQLLVLANISADRDTWDPDFASFADKTLLLELSRFECHAIVSGRNFALKPPNETSGSHRLALTGVADHVLSLATRGLECSSFATPGGSGVQQAGAQNASMCTYASSLLHKNGSELQLASSAAAYLQRDFIQSLVKQVHTCQGRYYTFVWTEYISWVNLFLVVNICIAFYWMIYLRLSLFQPRNRLILMMFVGVVLIFLHLWPLVIVSIAYAVASQRNTWPVPVTPTATEEESEYESGFRQKQLADLPWVESIRVICSSRVVLAYALTVFLQVSFTYLLVTLAFPRLDELREQVCHNNPYCENAFRYGPRIGTYLQCAIVLIAVVFNLRSYFHLRQHIMALPYDVIFGQDNIKEEYRYEGPDLVLFKEMAESSILWGMQFPAMVFWHFLVASWVLVVVAGVIVVPISMSAYGWNPTSFKITSAALIYTSLHLASYITRLFVQQCLVHQPGYSSSNDLDRESNDVHIRCLCFFSLWELWSCAVGLAMGPFDAVKDFLKGLLTTALASLIVEKPNFTQFGELSDNVYCSYCAVLYLERMREESRRRSRKRAQDSKGESGNGSSKEGAGSACVDLEPEIERTGYRAHCPQWFCGFLFFQFMVPIMMVMLVSYLGTVLPLQGSTKKYNDDPTAKLQTNRW